jgi:hypothetical protein
MYSGYYYGFSDLPALDIKEGEWPLLSEPQLRAILDYYAGPALQKMAGQGRFLAAAKQKDENIHQLARVFYDPSSINGALKRLEPGGQQVLARLQHSGRFGVLSYQKLVQQLASHLDANAVQAALASVVMSSLALYGFIDSQGKLRFEALQRKHQLAEPGMSDEDGVTVVLWSPSQILNAFKPSPQVLTAIAPSQLEPYRGLEPPQLVGPARFELLLADLLTFVRYLEQNRVKVLQSGGIGKRDYTKINEGLAVKEKVDNLQNASKLSDLRRLYFLWEVIYASGLVRVNPATSVAEVDQAELALFTTLPRHRQALVLLDSWAESLYHDLLRIAELRFPDPKPGAGHIPNWSEYKSARQDFIDLLHDLFVGEDSAPPELKNGGWLELASLWRYIKEHHFDFLITRQQVSRLYREYYEGFGYVHATGKEYVGIYNERKLRPAKAKNDYYSYGSGKYETLLLKADWDLVEGVWITQVLGEALNWLGLTELGQLPTDTTANLFFRFTPLGLATFDEKAVVPPTAEATSTAPVEQALIVQPNFDLLIIEPLRHLPLLRQLDSFATPINANESADNVALYKLTREAVLRAYRGGMNAEGILEILNRNSRVPVAPNIAISLHDWQAELERLVLRPAATLLEVSEPALLDRLLAEPELAGVVLRRYGPQLALVKAGTAELEKRLKQWLVAVEHLNPTRPDKGAISFSDPYTIKVQRATPYLLYQLGQFAELVEWQVGRRSATFRLTPQSVGNSRIMLPGRNDVAGQYEAIVAALQMSLPANSPISLETQLALKGWLRLHHNRGSRFQTRRAIVWKELNSEALDDLLRWPPFQQAVLERPGPNLVILDEAAFEALRSKLAAFGFDFT